MYETKLPKLHLKISRALKTMPSEDIQFNNYPQEKNAMSPVTREGRCHFIGMIVFNETPTWSSAKNKELLSSHSK